MNPSWSMARGPIVLSQGLRVFFLSAALFAVFSMFVWLGWLGIHAAGAAFTYVPFAPAPHQWHGHEMIYGYGAAVVAGFLLTAVPSWTGAAPSRMIFVSSIAALWLLGRLAVFFSTELSAVLVMLIDVAFIPVVSAKILLNLFKRPKPQNLMFLGLLALLILGNVTTHLEWIDVTTNTASSGLLTGLLTLAAFVTVLGGRLTPSFTRNALVRVGRETGLPETHAWLDGLGIGSSILLALLSCFGPDPRLLAAVATVAAVTNGLRLAGWRTSAVLDQPILWSLHLGFAMLVAGYAAFALHWTGLAFTKAAASHILGVGAIGGMTLAVMSRAALGHTGRALVVARPIAIAYALLALAAVVRSLGIFAFPDRYYLVMFVAGGLWIAVFTIFSFVYAPILTSPRLKEDS